MFLHNLTWLTHGNLLLVFGPCAALAAHRVYVQGRTWHAPLLLWWLAAAVQTHLTGVVLLGVAAALASQAVRDATWVETGGALISAAIPFAPGAWVGWTEGSGVEWGAQGLLPWEGDVDRLPVEVEVHGCGITGLDVFAVSAAGTCAVE